MTCCRGPGRDPCLRVRRRLIDCSPPPLVWSGHSCPLPLTLMSSRTKPRTGAQGLRVFPSHSETLGAPSLHYLQGRVAMLPTQRFCLFGITPVAYALVVPALRKEPEGRGTHPVLCASEIKSLGHPPAGLDLCTRRWRTRRTEASSPPCRQTHSVRFRSRLEPPASARARSGGQGQALPRPLQSFSA
jgi:hypothetical protein